MRIRLSTAALSALAFVIVSCSDNSITGPDASTKNLKPGAPALVVSPPVLPSVRISEFHYDNTGGDVGEQVEISGPAGTDLTGWKIYLYNGNGGATYAPTVSLSGTIPATCGARGVVASPTVGIQNGDPDGIALVDNGGNVVEFISYGTAIAGSFTASNGVASGMVSRYIGVKEASTSPVGQSLRRNSAGTWFGSAPNTFGACNDDTTPPADSTVATVVITPPSTTLVQGAKQQFSAAAANASSGPLPGAMIGWTSSDPTIATVDVNGVITAVLPGDVTITATSTNSISGTSSVHVNAAPPPSGLSDVRFTEIHYDNDGGDINERIEIEGPAGGDLTGWKVVLYNLTNGASYDTQVLNTTIPATCGARGVVVVSYPANGIQNGPSDGFALVNTGGQVIEFLSYEGTLTATNGPASGLLSTDIGPSEGGSGSANRSLQRAADGTWYGPASNTFGACNPAEPPPPSLSFTGRTPGDVPLPVGFQDQLFASLEDASGNQIPTTITWTSETPAVATIDQDGVFTALTAGSATFRATAGTGATDTWTLPTVVATQSATAMYGNNTEFGVPTDNDASDDFIITHPEYTSSFNKNRGEPNWVSYNLEASHFGAQDRCDCFTFDPAAAGIATPYTTNEYTNSSITAPFNIDRGHLTRSFDRTSGSLDNAFTFYFSNVVPQASAVNQGPWAQMENEIGNFATVQNKEVYVIAGASGNLGTLKSLGHVVIPAESWKVVVIMPKDQGLANVTSPADIQVLAVIMPNTATPNADWHTYQTTVDAVEALSGYDLLSLLPDPIEIAVESNTSAPTAAVDGPYSGYLPDEQIAMSGAGSSDPDAGQTLTYAWDFGDGATGTGVSVSHAYSAGGTYNVQLVVTDPLGLADTVTTTATVATPAEGVAEVEGLVQGLIDGGKVNNGNGKSLLSKLDGAIAALQNGQTNAGVNKLGAFLNELNAMVRSGRLSAADAAPLQDLVNRIIAAAT